MRVETKSEIQFQSQDSDTAKEDGVDAGTTR